MAVLLAFREGKSWVETAASVGTALLVAVSVGLEVHFGKKAEEASSALQRILEERTAEAEARAAEANARAAEAILKTEQERLIRARLEARLAPRTIAPDQVEKMVGVLRRFAGTEFTASVAKDRESRFLLYALVGAFKRANVPD